MNNVPKIIRMTPGPFDISPTVMSSALDATISHRGSEMQKVIRDIQEMLLHAVEIKNTEEYFPVFITGTGTAAMEAMVSSVASNKKPLALINGRFSRRLGDMCLIHNNNSNIIEVPAGNRFDVSQVEKFLKEDNTDSLFFCHQDTRDAILNPINDLSALTKKYNKGLFVDAISSEISEELNIEKNDIDMFCISSGKAIRSFQGIGIVIGKKSLLENLNPKDSKSYYLNLANHYRIQKDDAEPLFADSTPLLFCLRQALVELLKEGVTERRKSIREKTNYVRKELTSLGLKTLTPFEYCPSSVTSFLLPENISFDNFSFKLKSNGFLVYSGSSVIKDCFQVGTGGYINDDQVEAFVQTVKKVLLEFKV